MSASPEPHLPRMPSEEPSRGPSPTASPSAGVSAVPNRHLRLVPTPGVEAAGALLRAIADGDADAWHHVVHRYRGLLHHVTRQVGLTHEQREDVIQATWIRLFQHAGGLRRPEGLSSWLATTAIREALAMRRRSARERLVEAVPDAPANIDQVDDTVHLHLAAARLRAAVAELPCRERRLLEQLMAPEQPSYAEIALELRMPIGAIGPVRQRALRRLAPLLAGSWT